MPRLELNDAEARNLSDILESYLSDLRMEIADTEKMEWRTAMKERELFIKDIISQLATESG